MRLSIQERYTGVLFGIKRLNRIKDDFKRNNKEKDVEKILTGIDSLWHSVFSSSGDSAFWIFGSKIHEDRLTSDSPFATALISHKRDAEDWKPDSSLASSVEEVSDRHYSSYIPSMKSVLRGYNSSMFAFVLDVYIGVESILYYINRYQDGYAEDTKKICSLLMGECFSIMSDHNEFLMSYLLSKIAQKILSPNCSEENFCFAVFKKFNFHHDWEIPDTFDKKDVLEYINLWKKIREGGKGKEIRDENKLLIVLRIVGRRFHYKHLHKELLEMVVKHNDKQTCPEKRIREDVIVGACKKCAKKYSAHKKQQEDRRTEEKYCELTD